MRVLHHLLHRRHMAALLASLVVASANADMGCSQGRHGMHFNGSQHDCCGAQMHHNMDSHPMHHGMHHHGATGGLGAGRGMAQDGSMHHRMPKAGRRGAHMRHGTLNPNPAPDMMGMGHGMMGLGSDGEYLDRDLSTDDVKAILEHRLFHHGNHRLRVGAVSANDDDTIVAEVETVDGSLVERFAVDRHTGRMQRVQETQTPPTQ